jgi:hypothetical protein
MDLEDKRIKRAKIYVRRAEPREKYEVKSREELTQGA